MSTAEATLRSAILPLPSQCKRQSPAAPIWATFDPHRPSPPNWSRAELSHPSPIPKGGSSHGFPESLFELPPAYLLGRRRRGGIGEGDKGAAGVTPIAKRHPPIARPPPTIAFFTRIRTPRGLRHTSSLAGPKGAAHAKLGPKKGAAHLARNALAGRRSLAERGGGQGMALGPQARPRPRRSPPRPAHPRPALQARTGAMGGLHRAGSGCRGSAGAGSPSSLESKLFHTSSTSKLDIIILSPSQYRGPFPCPPLMTDADSSASRGSRRFIQSCRLRRSFPFRHFHRAASQPLLCPFPLPAALARPNQFPL